MAFTVHQWGFFCCAKQIEAVPLSPAQNPCAHFTHSVETLHVMKVNGRPRRESKQRKKVSGFQKVYDTKLMQEVCEQSSHLGACL